MKSPPPAALVAGAIILYSAGYLTGRGLGSFKSHTPPEVTAMPTASASAAPKVPEVVAPVVEAEVAAPAAPAASAATGPYAMLGDGTHVPPLPPKTPKEVRFGVVLVAYSGADPGAVAGGHKASRSRGEAKEYAEGLAETAKADFHAAVAKGDQGSADDLGRIHPGILEPAADYVLFTLPVGGVGGPVETPRGFWIVKRLE